MLLLHLLALPRSKNSKIVSLIKDTGSTSISRRVRSRRPPVPSVNRAHRKIGRLDFDDRIRVRTTPSSRRARRESLSRDAVTSGPATFDSPARTGFDFERKCARPSAGHGDEKLSSGRSRIVLTQFRSHPPLPAPRLALGVPTTHLARLTTVKLWTHALTAATRGKPLRRSAASLACLASSSVRGATGRFDIPRVNSELELDSPLAELNRPRISIRKRPRLALSRGLSRLHMRLLLLLSAPLPN